MKIKRTALFNACMVAMAVSFSSHAAAQSSEANASSDKEESPKAKFKVVVTGSYLRGKQISGVGPVTVINADAIKASGATSTESLLQRLPASAGYAGNQGNAYWADNGYGTTQVNLRGLGANRTLVLLNGRRVVSGGTGANSSVDLNTIPVGLIDRIEVLKDGASAIYGADAVAGVVNIITKQGFDGVEAGIRYGETTRGDGMDAAVNATYGAAGDSGSLMIALDMSKSGSINLASRAPCGLVESNGELVCSGSSTTVGGRAVLADGRRINFNQTLGGDGNFYETYSPAKHNYNGNKTLNAVNPIQRASLAVFGDRKLSETTRLFTELMYTRRESTQLATPGALGVYRPMNYSASHPTNPTGQDLLLQRRRLEEAGPRTFFQKTNTFRAVVGADGRINDRWDWTAALNWGRNTGIDGSTRVANLDRVDATLDTSRCSWAINAAIPCADYLGYGDVTARVLDYILFDTRDHGGNEQQSFTANIGGRLGTWYAGDIGVATGVEIRREKGWRYPDALTVAGIANTNQNDRIEGAYTAKEVFTEISLPILRDSVIAKSMTLNAALRYSSYDLFGNDTNYKIGLDWQIVDAFKIRANHSTGFRVPNIPELFGGVSEGNLTTTDPCNNWNLKPSSSVVYQNCQKSGLPLNYRQLGNTILTTTGGNPNLEPEDSTSSTVGFVWTPKFIPGFTFTGDYFNIRIDNAIQRIAGSTKLAICYNTPDMKHQFCEPTSFTRNKLTGEVDFLSSQPVNAATERVAGIDIGGIYERKIGSWTSVLNFDISRLLRYDVTPFDGADTIEYAGKITGGRGSYTQLRSYSSLTLKRRPWAFTYGVQFIGRADDINASPGDIGDHAPALAYHNAQVKFSPTNRVDYAFGVDNLFDKKAPYIQSYTDGNTDTMTYDLMGRRWYVSVNYRF